MGYKQNRTWSDNLLPKVKIILSDFVIKESTYFEDTKQVTDLKTNSSTFGVRIRTYEYFERYPDDFTVRKTELPKIMEGYPDFYFYGFLNREQSDFIRYFIGDMFIFRRWYFDNDIDRLQLTCLKNRDGSHPFYVFNIKNFPKNFIVKTNINSTYQRKINESNMPEMHFDT